jgi:hypothetical protein
MGGMLPGVDALFTLVRQLAQRQAVTDVAVPKWLVQRHGLASLAARAGAGSYRDDLARATLAWAQTERALPRVVKSLREAGVRVAAIKGVAFAKSLYAAPAERPMNDVDLLVARDQREAAEQALRKLGFEPGNSALLHHAKPWFLGDFVIDLHTNIIAPGRARIDLQHVWSRTSPGWPEGAETLAPEDSLAFHLIHLARNRLCLPLINVVDTARHVERITDPRTVLVQAREWGLGTACEVALEFCMAILDDGRAPARWFSPSLDDIAHLTEPSNARKILFDVMIAGSTRQLVARAVHFGANKLRSVIGRTG